MLANTCPHCGKDMGGSPICPHCEHKREAGDDRPVKKHSSWLTLLIIILCFLGAVAVILVPNFLRARASGQFTTCQFNLKNLGTALEMYSTDHQGHYPKTMDELVDNNYIEEIPHCQTYSRDTYSQTYVSSVNPDAYTFYCKGRKHMRYTGSPDYPQYNSYQGLINGY